MDDYYSIDTLLPEWTLPSGKRLKPGDSVELQSESDADPDFFRIKLIFDEGGIGIIKLRGSRLRRTSCLNGELPSKLNEVAIIMVISEHQARGEAGLEDIDIEDVVGKRKIIFTNRLFPGLSFREHTAFDSRKRNAIEVGKSIRTSSELVCRWKYIQVHRRGHNKPIEGALCRLREADADPGRGIPDSSLRYEWIGVLPELGADYSFGDAFCGAGGVSEGARQAGLKVHWGFDKDWDACRTYDLNQAEAQVLNETVDVFIHTTEDPQVVIMHISAPCTAFSPANYKVNHRDHNTETGRRDEEAQAASLCIGPLLRRVRPRRVTLEQTSGIVERHEAWLNVVIHQFTDAGYSVRWALLNFYEYGHPHSRTRLIIFASCPGSAVPEFPNPTHGEPGLGREPWPTIGGAISHILPGAPNHDRTFYTVPRPAYPENQRLSRLIATGGTDDCHPSGTRSFTLRELACLMNLPMRFRFPGNLGRSAIKRQIGNMVPPVVMKTLFGRMTESLRAEDVEWLAAAREGTAQPVISETDDEGWEMMDVDDDHIKQGGEQTVVESSKGFARDRLDDEFEEELERAIAESLQVIKGHGKADSGSKPGQSTAPTDLDADDEDEGEEEDDDMKKAIEESLKDFAQEDRDLRRAIAASLMQVDDCESVDEWV